MDIECIIECETRFDVDICEIPFESKEKLKQFLDGSARNEYGFETINKELHTMSSTS